MPIKKQNKTTGQGLLEYSILILLIVVTAIQVLRVTGVDVKQIYCNIVKSLGGSSRCETYCQNHFENLTGWNLYKNTGWSSQNGMLCNTKPGEQQIINQCSTGKDIPSDYVVNVDIANLLAGNGYGVFFRTQPGSTTQGYVFQYDPGMKGFVFRKWINGYETAPIAVSYVQNYQWLNTPRKVEIVVIGDTFTAYIDGQKVLNVKDSTFKSGGAGFRTWDSTTACFDDFSITVVP